MNMQKKILTLTLSGVLVALSVEQSALARGGSSSGKVWTYLKSYNSTNYDTNTGKPKKLASGCTVPDGIMDKVLRLLPEGNALAIDSPLFTEDTQANILLKKDANIKVAFVGEGAGYTNALGFFSFDKTKLTSLTSSSIVEKIVFPNFSAKNSGGDLSLGDTVDLGTIAAGKGVGFTVVSNGWQSNQVRSDRTDNQIFRTVKNLNPEPSSQKLNYHTVLLSDPESKVLVISIEDLNRQSSSYNDNGYVSDNDFNDAILAICVDPFDAIEGVDTLINIDTGTEGTSPTETDPTPDGTDGTEKIKGAGGRQSWSERTVPSSM
ncbi:MULTISPECIES: DUF4114 domain-containing protein [Methylomicrobium]|uniref:DUF4114 domain-containing protein n=1 Tax=Methylomicrobium album BG8 TaxID=686340 RepID=H8GK31_METAL|nr:MULTISPECIES: DUF4114 domain-containing protein [Methylomicrobium]EIC29155.1 hypothetical protein Metal_1368 [Methylomicrobium album BG8]